MFLIHTPCLQDMSVCILKGQQSQRLSNLPGLLEPECGHESRALYWSMYDKLHWEIDQNQAHR